MSGSANVHKSLGPSGAEKWAICPGALRAESYFVQNYPELVQDSSRASRLGTLVHDLCEILLTNPRYNMDKWQLPDDEDEFTDAEREEGIACALAFREYVLKLCNKRKGDLLIVEEFVNIHRVHPECGGTADAIVFNKKTGMMHVCDYKHGIGWVTIEWNKQLLLYAIGSMDRLRDMGHRVEGITIHIFQPRIDNIGSHEVTVKELWAFAEEMEVAAYATEEEDAPLVPGEKQCQWCIAKPTCKARNEQTMTKLMPMLDLMETIAEDNGATTAEARLDLMTRADTMKDKIKMEEEAKDGQIFINGDDTLDIEQLIELHKIAPQITKYMKIMKEFLELAAAAGRAPGLKMVQGDGANVCKDSDTVDLVLGDDAWHPLPTERKMKSVTDLKKLCKKQGDDFDELLGECFGKTKGKPTMVTDDDPRNALSSTKDLLDAMETIADVE